MTGLGTILIMLGAASPPLPPAPPGNLVPAWAMLSILVVIVTALLGLLLLTILRPYLRRKALPPELPVYEEPKTAAWQIAGQRAVPVDEPGTDDTGEADDQED